MVARDLAPPARIDRGDRLFADADVTGDDSAEVGDDALGRSLGVLDANPAARSRDRPRVADLAARLCIKRRALDEDLDTPAALRVLDRAARSREPEARALVEEGRALFGLSRS